METNISKDGLAVEAASIDDLNAEARVAADKEHNLTFIEAIKSYPTAVAWALFFSLGVIMAVCACVGCYGFLADVFRLLILSSLAIFMRLQHSKKTSATSTKADTSFRRRNGCRVFATSARVTAH